MRTDKYIREKYIFIDIANFNYYILIRFFISISTFIFIFLICHNSVCTLFLIDLLVSEAKHCKGSSMIIYGQRPKKII